MKDVVLYVFLFALYSVLALKVAPLNIEMTGEVLSWETFGRYLLLFAGSAMLARWSVLAFKPKPERLLSGQKIVGIEEQVGDQVLDVIRPQQLRRELKKPKLKGRK